MNEMPFKASKKTSQGKTLAWHGGRAAVRLRRLRRLWRPADPAMTDALSKFDDYVFYPEQGGEAFAIGLVICLFFYDGMSPHKIAARTPLLESFCRLADNQLDIYVPLNTETPVRNVTSDQVLRHFRDQMANLDTRSADILCGFSGADRGRGDPQRFYIEIALGSEGSAARAKPGHMLAYLPAGWLDRVGREKFVDQVRDWASLVGAAHGTAGLGCQFSFASSFGGYNFFPYLKRYIGLDMGDVNMWLFETSQTSEKLIRTTNWLNFIDNSFVDRLGGRGFLADALGKICDMADYDGGIMIRAGSMPEVGDVNEDDIPPKYRAIARALAPIRFEAFRHKNAGMFSTPSSFNNLKESKAWVRRLD